MSKLKLLPYKDLFKIAQRAGFNWVRCEGSHNTFHNSSGSIIVIPDRGNQVIVRPLLRKIIRDLGLTIDEYNRLAEEL